MKKERIIWVDDNINTRVLEPYVDEFEDNEVEIIKVKSVASLPEILKNEVQKSLSAILVDIIMPSENLDFGETDGGLRTGIVVLNNILKDDTLKNIPIIAVTNVDDVKVRDYCEANRIPCLKKSNFFSDTFVEAVRKEIENYKK